jgi:hypothetical protein
MLQADSDVSKPPSLSSTPGKLKTLPSLPKLQVHATPQKPDPRVTSEPAGPKPLPALQPLPDPNGFQLIHGGILSYLETKHHGDMSANRIPIETWQGRAKQLIWDFQQMRVNLSHYSLTHADRCHCGKLTVWILEGSVDGRTWTELDRLVGSTGHGSRFEPKARQFEVSTRMVCRFIRLTKTCVLPPTDALCPHIGDSQDDYIRRRELLLEVLSHFHFPSPRPEITIEFFGRLSE